MLEVLCQGRWRPRAAFGVVMEKVHRLASSGLKQTILAFANLAG